MLPIPPPKVAAAVHVKLAIVDAPNELDPVDVIAPDPIVPAKVTFAPENVAAVRAGLRDGDLWDAYVNVSYVDETCSDNTCDRSGTDNIFRKTDDYTLVDLSGSYALNPSSRVYAKVDNVLDDQEIVSRSPHGARPNLPRTAYVGISVDF